MNARKATSLVLLALAAGLGAQDKKGPAVVASTSWTAAIAGAAGAGSIVTIAPTELRHPPEYELKPSDLLAVKGADYLVHSGYERFATRLAEVAGAEGLEVIQVYTDNLPPKFLSEARALSLRFGTLAAHEAWAKEFSALTEGIRERLSAAYQGKPVAVHQYLRTWAEWMGLEVACVFGPGEIAPGKLLELSRSGADVVIDNYHARSGAPLAQALGVPLAYLVNFPGPFETKDIEDVFLLNEKALLSVLE